MISFNVELFKMEPVAHVVVFSELSPKSKVQYTRLLLDSNAKVRVRPLAAALICRSGASSLTVNNPLQFVKSDGKYTANILLQAPRTDYSSAKLKGCGKSATIPCATADAQHQSIPVTESEAPPQSDPRLASIPLALHKFANLIFLIEERNPASRSDGGGKFVKETRLVRLINEIYDARYDDMTVSNKDAQDKPSDSYYNASRSSSSNVFCRFIKHYLTNRFGLKTLMDQHAWELIDGLNSLQSTSANSECKLKKSASTSAVATPVWLSKAQVESLAQTIFGSKKTEDVCLQVRDELLYVNLCAADVFMVAMKAFLRSQPSGEGRTPAKLVEANELLYIATETYRKYSAAAADVAVNPDSTSGTQSMSMNATRSPIHSEGEDIDEKSTAHLHRPSSNIKAQQCRQLRVFTAVQRHWRCNDSGKRDHRKRSTGRAKSLWVSPGTHETAPAKQSV
ncbi:hypothetical protein FI667_g8423, partial [Globisporangium splendens]